MVMGNRRYTISPEEYIFATLNIYVDIIYIFSFLLQLFGSQDWEALSNRFVTSDVAFGRTAGCNAPPRLMLPLLSNCTVRLKVTVALFFPACCGFLVHCVVTLAVVLTSYSIRSKMMRFLGYWRTVEGHWRSLKRKIISGQRSGGGATVVRGHLPIKAPLLNVLTEGSCFRKVVVNHFSQLVAWHADIG